MLRILLVFIYGVFKLFKSYKVTNQFYKNIGNHLIFYSEIHYFFPIIQYTSRDTFHTFIIIDYTKHLINSEFPGNGVFS